MNIASSGKQPQWQGRLIWLRRLSQLGFLTLFFILFLQTDYNGTDKIESAVNVFFRLDPFLALCVTLAAKVFVSLMWPALLIVVATILAGRFFCGWFCPLGTLLDLVTKILPGGQRFKPTWMPRLPRIILTFCLVSALCGWTVYGLFDPFSLLTRGMAQGLYPALNSLSVDFFTFTYQELPDVVNSFTEPVYALLQEYILPSAQKFFQLSFLSLFLLLIIFSAEAVHKRFFCRNVCPLGALLGVISGSGLLVAKGGDDACGKCRICRETCRMGAVHESREISTAACSLCLECVAKCPKQIIHFGAGFGWDDNRTLSLSRRQLMLTTAAAILLPMAKRVDAGQTATPPWLIRPPGALAEKEFLARCVRCAECIQVCIGNVLQPAFMDAGVDGMFSPVVMARTGYCEFNCTLCGQVCPTGAIQSLSLEQKHTWKIGHAWFDKNLCLPYAKNVSCMVCEEHCPTPEKAIRFQSVTVTTPDGQQKIVKQPYIVDELCIGCGICETKCPLPGKAAIRITSAGETRNPDAHLPASATDGYGYGS